MKNLYVFILMCIGTCYMLNAQPVPTAYYPFNGNADDAGTNAINGVTYGSPVLTTDVSGNQNSAYEFDGINDYINLGNSMILKPTTAVSLALWAYSTNWASFTSWAALAGNTASGGYELIIHGSSATIEAECKRNGAYAIADYPLSSLSSGWHHFAFTFDGRYTILYVDGIAVDTDDAGAVYPIQYGYPGNSTIIGDEAGSGNTPEGDPFTGKIDEVRFYDVALTAQEILSLYNASAGVSQPNTQENPGILYPNPASGAIIIETPDGQGDYLLSISDAAGKVLYQGTHTPAANKITVGKPAQLPAGLYFVSLKTPEGQCAVYRVVYR